MIPLEYRESIFPEIADGTGDAAVLEHACGIAVQFFVETLAGERFSITRQHLKSWRAKLKQVAASAGHNCFGYNTLIADPEGVYHDDDRNMWAILFAPGTFLEHNPVDGTPLLLVINEEECILTGSESEEGQRLIQEYLPKSLASKVVTIDRKWEQWIEDAGVAFH